MQRTGDSPAVRGGAAGSVYLSDDHPDYFIFDEATSALDTVSEHLVQNAMENCVAGQDGTYYCPSAGNCEKLDRILVTDGGKIARDGTYDDLMQQEGIFRNLVQGQVLRS